MAALTSAAPAAYSISLEVSADVPDLRRPAAIGSVGVVEQNPMRHRRASPPRRWPSWPQGRLGGLEIELDYIPIDARAVGVNSAASCSLLS
jgi:hypothetical protein